MNKVKFRRVNEEQLPQQINNGSFYITKDSDKLFLDINDKRLKINSSGMIYDKKDLELNFKLEKHFDIPEEIETMWIHTITKIDNEILFVLWDDDTGYIYFASSTDGVNFSYSLISEDVNWENAKDILHVGNYYYVTVPWGGLFRSSDKIIWETCTLLDTDGNDFLDGKMYRMTYGNGNFIINIRENEESLIYYSNDFETWNKITLPYNYIKINFVNNLFIGTIAQEYINKIIVSEDGINWEDKDIILTDHPDFNFTFGNIDDYERTIIYFNDSYYALSDMDYSQSEYEAFITSKDLINWSKINDDMPIDIKYNNNYLIYYMQGEYNEFKVLDKNDIITTLGEIESESWYYCEILNNNTFTLYPNENYDSDIFLKQYEITSENFILQDDKDITEEITNLVTSNVVQDVQVDSVSKLSDGIANFTSKTLTFIKSDGTQEQVKVVLG